MNKIIVIHNVTVIPMPKHTTLPHRTVIIEGDRIVRIFSASQFRKNAYRAAKVIDGKGRFLIPGLFDMHVHLQSQSFFPLFLSHGVTAIREVGSAKKDIFAIRDRLNEGKLIGPRMFACGPILEGNPPLWKGFKVIESEREAREYVLLLKKRRSDFVKVYHTLEPHVYYKILKTAHRLGLKVTGHIPRALSVFDAITAGQDGIEHLDSLDNEVMELTFLAHRVIRVEKNEEALTRLLHGLQKADTAVCPTLVQTKKIVELGNYQKLAKNEEALYLPRYYREKEWNPNHPKCAPNIRHLNLRYLPNMEFIFEKTKMLVGIFQEKGILLLAGSDTPNPFVIPGFSLLQELELLVGAGLKPYQALETATYNAAKFLTALSDFGTIEEGKIANMVLLTKNPLDRISNIRRIESVFLGGKYLPIESLRKGIKLYK